MAKPATRQPQPGPGSKPGAVTCFPIASAIYPAVGQITNNSTSSNPARQHHGAGINYLPTLPPGTRTATKLGTGMGCLPRSIVRANPIVSGYHADTASYLSRHCTAATDKTLIYNETGTCCPLVVILMIMRSRILSCLQINRLRFNLGVMYRHAQQHVRCSMGTSSQLYTGVTWAGMA